MDVSTFMATISPIAAVAVLPLAIAEGGVFGMSGTGWTYTVILAFLTGLAAHGWNVYAQKTIPIGTIGVAQVAQPALAVVWAFLLLSEELVWGARRHRGRHRGLLAFILLNERGGRVRAAEQDGEIALAGEGSGGCACRAVGVSGRRPGRAR